MYRLFLPHLHTPHSRFCFSKSATPVKDLADADIVVVQRQCSQANIIALKNLHDMGIKLVYDLDDDLWSIPGSSPAKKIFEPVKSGFGKCMEFCDAVTVSTERLKTAVKTSVKEIPEEDINVIPN